ncbi:aminoacyl-tRNA hydrolase [Malacoplasma iowae]|uniref:aminoacyl-tRNA hydrolase n=1 Tax=Malacoplasma iowae TaxID=2116 RepID=UPI003872CE79|nr:aminoacyl-tRNA hydrolase [Malacoplasma iowae]
MDKYLVVGLGNPGFQYENTKHNVGFNVIDSLCKKINISLLTSKFNGVFSKANLYNKEVYICKPQTYMNLSGEFVSKFVNFYKIPIENVLVIYDDLDSEIGKIKLKIKGSSGGQNGIKNIINLLGTESIKRIKIGISRPERNISISGYVLSKFNNEDKTKVEKSIDKASDAILFYLENDFTQAMNKFNGG